MDYKESAIAIQSDGIDVLMEMQLHTLGQRMQITAYHPATLQVNYLVYPGTSGAYDFLSHIVADPVVVSE